jgi:PfaD family protein
MDLPAAGRWLGDPGAAAVGEEALTQALRRVEEPLAVVRTPGGLAVVSGGRVELGNTGQGGFPVVAVVPPLRAGLLGDRHFRETYGVRHAYMTGAMANGIATADMVVAMGRAGMLGSFGAAGLSLERVEENVLRIKAALPGGAWCANLIHSPSEPGIEQAVVDLYLRHGVTVVEAAAFMALTPMLVQYRLTGLTRRADGAVVARNHLVAKVSRPEVAAVFMAPAPASMVDALVAAGKVTREEAALARNISVADDVTAEADSGGHTDNRALTVLYPLVAAVRDQVGARGSGGLPVRVGAAGGLATPHAVAAAFSMGAAYVVTGSVNQACRESGLCAAGKAMLAAAGMADVMMAPAADMFEMGVKVQVLKRGTMFGLRAQKLYDLYRLYESWEEVPAKERERLEQQVFKRRFDDVWAETQSYWQRMEPKQLERAATSAKHKMGLCFRWYLGLASRWAIRGEMDRVMDWQVWCGPAMGAFNAWVKGSPLEPVERRDVVTVARNLLDGAAVVLRASMAAAQGVPVPPQALSVSPLTYAPATLDGGGPTGGVL